MGTSIASPADQELADRLYKQGVEILGQESTAFRMAIDGAVKDLRVMFGNVIPKKETDRLVHDYVLQEKFPDRFVAYLEDETEEEGETRLQRETRAAAPSLAKLEQLIKALPTEQQKRIEVRYVRDPLAGFRLKAN
ncbi:MAG TPA: hypothetical protein VI913_02465 [Candidatus Peribacteraceae bacterium]|nr:hypothetical protein [Candidatus Peribacteraceae bacterium]